MPKIIENLEAQLIAEARKQVEEAGYSAMTIRSVAKACGVGVGTVYNYFPSKDAMVAAYMLADWRQCIAVIDKASVDHDDAVPVVRCIYDQLKCYAEKNSALFHDKAAEAGFAGSFGKYHGTLRAQLAEPLRKFCRDDFTAEFIAESLLTWTLSGESFERLCAVVEKILY